MGLTLCTNGVLSKEYGAKMMGMVIKGVPSLLLGSWLSNAWNARRL